MDEKKNKQIELCRPLDLEDCCITAAINANERFLQRQQAAKEHRARQGDARYHADDSDLPAIFFEPFPKNSTEL